MVAGKLVKLTATADLLAHVRKIRRATKGITKGLGFHDELGKLDVVQRAGAVGQLNTCLQLHITLPHHRKFPTQMPFGLALNGERLAADTPGGWHGSKHRVARHRAFHGDRRNHINQGIQRRLFLWHRQGKAGVLKDLPVQGGLNRTGGTFWPGLNGLRLTWLVLARQPDVLHQHPEQHQSACDDQPPLQLAHVYPASVIERAASMSTATMRDTPCSCIVTPINCLAISIAILLWLMNKNWVSRLMLVTSLA